MSIDQRIIKYGEWIQENVSQPCHGMCETYAKEMSKSFPELHPVAGRAEVEDLVGDRYLAAHWWCEDDQGNVIDPTVKQFLHVVNYIGDD